MLEAEAYEYSRQAKSVCRPSSLLMSSLEKVRPCMKPRFFSQKMLQKLHSKSLESSYKQSIAQFSDPNHSRTVKQGRS